MFTKIRQTILFPRTEPLVSTASPCQTGMKFTYAKGIKYLNDLICCVQNTLSKKVGGHRELSAISASETTYRSNRGCGLPYKFVIAFGTLVLLQAKFCKPTIHIVNAEI
jgi:hypothetical protein